MALGRPDAALEHWGFDLALAPPLHPAQAALRLEALVRAAVAEEEFELRGRHLRRARRQLLAPGLSADPLRVLAVGEPAPQFLALSNALRANGARDDGGAHRLHRLRLSARARRSTPWCCGPEKPTPRRCRSPAACGATRASTTRRRCSTCARAPTVALCRSLQPRRLRRRLAPRRPKTRRPARVIALARAYRRQTAIRAALEQARGSGLMDAATGLFTRDLFAAHLARLAEASPTRRRPLSVACCASPSGPRSTEARAAAGSTAPCRRSAP